MEKRRNSLKILSIVILIFVAISLGRIITDACVNGFGNVGEVPEGVSETVAQVIVVIVWSLGIVFLLPQVYLGVKGIMVSKGQSEGRAHIIWAIILTVFSTFSVISGIVGLTKGFTTDKLLTLLDVSVNVILFGAYYITARKIATEQ